MRVGDVCVLGLGVHQPPTVDAGQAARSGLYDPASYLENRLTGACVAGDAAPPDMAVDAARQAMSRAAADPARVAMVLHATVFFQGPEMWLPAPYIQREVVGSSVPAFELRVGCNGMFAALELAAARMATLPPEATVLATAAENLGSPLIDRWNGAPGFIEGDAGSAFLLGRSGGFARLLAVGSSLVPELEPLHRGAEPLYPPAITQGRMLGMQERVLHFREHVMSLEKGNELAQRALLELVERTLDEADRKLEEMTRVIYVNAAGYVLNQQLLEPLGLDLERTTWQFGRGIGHTGPSDHLLSLNHLMVTGQLGAGDHVMMVGGAPGCTQSCAVFEITDVPEWALA